MHSKITNRVITFALFCIAVFLLFYNLQINPRPWQDEGAMLTLAKTVANEGVYAIKNSDGYQTFGAVQSVGPTVILPVAASFKAFGVGFWQARWVIGAYSLLCLVALCLAGRKLFGAPAAWVACVFLVAASGSVYLLWSRQVFGEVPALAFFWWGWWVWAGGKHQTPSASRTLSAGLLMGLAMLTKSQYVLLVGGAIALLLLADLFYFKQKQTLNLILLGGVAGLCVVLWTGIQYLYFGADTFAENTRKLQELARAASGLNLYSTREAVRSLLGAGNGHLYPFWGLPALFFGFLFVRKTREGLAVALLLISAWLWLAYYLFWSIHWQANLIFPTSVAALFLGKWVVACAQVVRTNWKETWAVIQSNLNSTAPLNTRTPVPTLFAVMGCVLALCVFSTWTLDELQTNVRRDVLDRVGAEERDFPRLGQLQAPHELAAYLNQAVPTNTVIETWDRELGMLTEHRYHFLDQIALAKTQVIVRGGTRGKNFGMGQEYFQSLAPQPKYLVIGRYARVTQIYNMDYVNANAELVNTIGTGDTRYEVYRFKS